MSDSHADSELNPPVMCPLCRARLTLFDWLDAAVLCWPYKRWARAVCPECHGEVYLLPGYDTVAIGTLDFSSDATLIPSTVLRPEEYSTHWSASGMRVTIAERRWTARADDNLW